MCGAGCLFIHRSILETMGWPWFTWVEFPNGNSEGEDIGFARRVREIGEKVVCVGDLICEHYKPTPLVGALVAMWRGLLARSSTQADAQSTTAAELAVP